MKNRNFDTISQTITNESKNNDAFLIFCSPSDVGVRRNKGRNGAKLAPKGIINVLKKFVSSKIISEKGISIVNTTEQDFELKNFDKAQKLSAQKMSKSINENTNTKKIHIGGGHDHAFPLLMALHESPKHENILILNIDAHCDTRVDSICHSGTPFRDFDSFSKKPVHLIQYGLHHFSNSEETLSSLNNCSTENFFFKDLAHSTENFSLAHQNLFTSCPFKVTKQTAIFLSLDCDAISGNTMKAVSAVNPQGIPLHHIQTILSTVTREYPENQITLGIYEFNPVYDDLSQLGAKSVASLIYNFLN